MNIWEFLIWVFWVYILITCIWIFITVIIDIFRDPTLNGWSKALWILFLVVLPFLAAFIYLIARSKSMTDRRLKESAEMQAQSAAYIREVSGTGVASPSAEISQAKALLDAGAITQAEYDALKAKALT